MATIFCMVGNYANDSAGLEILKLNSMAVEFTAIALTHDTKPFDLIEPELGIDRFVARFGLTSCYFNPSSPPPSAPLLRGSPALSEAMSFLVSLALCP